MMEQLGHRIYPVTPSQTTWHYRVDPLALAMWEGWRHDRIAGGGRAGAARKNKATRPKETQPRPTQLPLPPEHSDARGQAGGSRGPTTSSSA